MWRFAAALPLTILASFAGLRGPLAGRRLPVEPVRFVAGLAREAPERLSARRMTPPPRPASPLRISPCIAGVAWFQPCWTV